MKQLLFFITLFFFQVQQCMEVISATPQQKWRDAFKNLDTQKYNHVVQYDLNLELWEDNREKVIHQNVSLLAHGFGASPTTMSEYARLEGPYSVPGDKITFQFKDAFRGNLDFIRHSSFGQHGDIKSLLVALKAVCDCCWIQDKVGCNLFGQSRGAGAVANMLAILNTKIHKWDADFSDIKEFLKDKDRVEMLLMIKKGVVVLDTPMVTTHVGVKSLTNLVLRGSCFEPPIVSLIHDYCLPILTWGNYSPSGMQALTSVADIPQDLKLLVSFQLDDEFVGNHLDKDFSEILSRRLGPDNLWVVLGNDKGKQFDDETWEILEKANQEEKLQKRWLIGGLPYRTMLAHGAGFISLFQSGVLNAFFKKHNCSYYEGCIKLITGAKILEKAHRVKNFKQHFKNYDMNNDADRTSSSV